MSEEIKENIKAYYIGSDIDKVLDYIQQKENKEKEIREYIESGKSIVFLPTSKICKQRVCIDKDSDKK